MNTRRAYPRTARATSGGRRTLKRPVVSGSALRWLAAAGCGLTILLGMACPAPAQTALERIESRVREQLQQPGAAPAAPDSGTVKGPTPAAAVTPALPPLPPPPSATSQTPTRASAGNFPAASGHAYLGLVGDDKDSRGQGVRILHVRPGGPAAHAGVRDGDLIISLGGMHLRQMSELADMLDLYKPGDRVPVVVVRNGQSQKIEITLGSRPQVIVTFPVPEGSAAQQAIQPPAVPRANDGPTLTPPAPPAKQVTASAEDHPSQIEQLQRRIEQLEQRVGELERRK